jgi:hypothetical protein
LEIAWRRAICFAQSMKARLRQLLYEAIPFVTTVDVSDEC